MSIAFDPSRQSDSRYESGDEKSPSHSDGSELAELHAPGRIRDQIGAVDLPAPFRADILKMVRVRDGFAGEVTKFEKEFEENGREYDRTYDQAGFRERHLWRWLGKLLGGDKSVMTKLDTLTAAKEDLSEKIAAKQAEEQGAERALRLKIHSHLENHNHEFAKLSLQRGRVDRTLEAVNGYLELVERAIVETDEAEDMELMDSFSSNKGISAWSYAETEEASSAIEAVSRATPRLQKALTDYNESLAGAHFAVPDGVGFANSIDLMFDFAFDNSFDFMSWSNYAELSDAEDRLRELSEEVKKIGWKVEEHLKKIDSAMGRYRDAVETACASRPG